MELGRVAYVWSEELQTAADQLPSNLGRSSVVHDLIKALDLLQLEEGDPSLIRDGIQGAHEAEIRGVDTPNELRGARVVRPDGRLGSEDNLKRYHDAKYVGPSDATGSGVRADSKDYLTNPTAHQENANDDEGSDDDSLGSDNPGDSDDSYTPAERPAKRRRTEHGLEHDCPSFPALPVYARLVAAATQTACRELVAGTTDIAICWDGGRHHTMRNRASGFCYVADVVLGIMYLAKSGRPRAISGGRQGGARGTDRPSGANDVSAEAGQGSRGASSSSDDLTRDATTEDGGSTPAKPDRPSRRPRIMYIDLDIHEGDGVHQAFLSPSRYPASTSTKKPPRPPQVLTLSIHHHSRTFFPPHKPFSGLPDRETPSPFTLSIPLHACASPSAYAGIWPSVEGIKGSFNPDYVVLQLGLDGLPGDRVGQYGAWGTEGPGGLRWCVQQVRSWGLPLCVLGGGGYDNANAARGWTMATAELLGHRLDENTHVPDHEHLPLYGPSFTLEVPKSYARDENTKEYIDEINDTFSHVARRIQHVVASYDA